MDWHPSEVVGLGWEANCDVRAGSMVKETTNGLEELSSLDGDESVAASDER